MAVITPNSDVILLKVPLEISNDNQLTFANATAQYNYFNGLTKKVLDNYTYQRKDGTIRVGELIDNLYQYNYVMYRNTNHSNKWFYAYITGLEYLNDNVTAIKIKTDTWQTWQFDLTYKPVFVEREHVNDDTVGKHTVPENLETGDYINKTVDYYTGLDSFYYVLQCTKWADDPSGSNKPLYTNFGGVIMAGGAYVTSDPFVLVNILQLFSQNGISEDVYNVYMIPQTFLTNSSGTAQYSGQNAPVSVDYTVNKTTTIDDYTPKNKKLLCFPYNFLTISNNNGTSNVLHYERFSTSNCTFQIKGVPTVGGSIKCLPKSYDGISVNEEEGIMAGKLPTLNWSEDGYTNWLTQNSVNIGTGIASSALTIAGGLGLMATGGGAVAGAGSIVSGAIAIANQIGSIYQHSFQPNSAKGNVNGGDINTCDSKNGFFFYHTCIKKEYAEIIDNFWNCYGYKVNVVKIPNITGRTNWNYVKTIGCYIEADIPQDDLQEIKGMFDRGVTFWHNPLTFGDYSQSNAIVV